MIRIALALSLMTAPIMAQADIPSGAINSIVNEHILPRFQDLADQTQSLSKVAATQCDSTSEALRSAYGAAFDAWVSASHLRFGPSEVDARAFALAFWPDSRGATPRALSALLTAQDPIAASVEQYADVSIAARGFYAMEMLLFDEVLMASGTPAYHCQLIQTITADMALTAAAILEGWQPAYATEVMTPSAAGVYRSEEEVLQEMFKALSTGLQFTADTRLRRPLGTFDRPYPSRAEAYRSGRSARHVMVSLSALQDLAGRLAGEDASVSAALDAEFTTAQSQLADLDDPAFAGVAFPQTRLKIEALQQSVDAIRTTVSGQLGPKLGVAAGFNSLDGD
jgi:predicted lipoprotein